MNDLSKLAALIKQERASLLKDWRDQVRQLPSARHLDVPTLNDHIPELLDELALALHTRSDETIQQALIEGSPQEHGSQRVLDGFDIAEVVAEYNLLRGCVHDLGERNGLTLQGRPFHIINQVLDGAIGIAVQSFSEQQALAVQRRREEYLAFVAHDLRTPLNAISMVARVLETKLPSASAPEEAGRLLRSLHRNAQLLTNLVGKVLDENSNVQNDSGVKLERRAFDLWPLVESLIRDTGAVASDHGTQLVNKVPDDLIVYADASVIWRVFENLIANAIRYTPQGTVCIEAFVLDANGAVECRVIDDGAGIAADLVDHVFDKGVSDAKSAAGSGLGLAIVKSFVEAHGGEVSVQSTHGAGSTIRFTLPPREPLAGT